MLYILLKVYKAIAYAIGVGVFILPTAFTIEFLKSVPFSLTGTVLIITLDLIIALLFIKVILKGFDENENESE